jgi:hypothetical protein
MYMNPRDGQHELCLRRPAIIYLRRVARPPLAHCVKALDERLYHADAKAVSLFTPATVPRYYR